MDTPTFNELSICAGYGGLGMGVGIAVPGTRGVCYVEREAASIEILAARMQDGSMAEAPIWTDLCTFDGGPWRGVVDIITAGIPCQPWSLAGKQAGFADERHLGEELVRVVGEVGPSYVFVENVSGFVRLGAPDLLGRLSEIGYDAEWGIFSAADVGATHRRQRFFLLAYRQGMADSDSGGLSGKRTGNDHHRGNARGRITYRCDEELADPNGDGLLDGEHPKDRRGAGAANERRSEVADPERPRPQGEPGPKEQGPHDWATRRGGRAAFPPGPNGDWSGIPEEFHPAVGNAALDALGHLRREQSDPGQKARRGEGEPGRPGVPERHQEATESHLRGVADGAPGRVDRLRMLGNGVVPLQAAYAFTTLYRRISS